MLGAEKIQGETYPDLLKRALQRPESLSDADWSRVTDDDYAFLLRALDNWAEDLRQQLARIIRRKRGDRIFQAPAVNTKRQMELLALAKRDRFYASLLTHEELRAIDATSGLWDRIFEAMPEAQA